MKKIMHKMRKWGVRAAVLFAFALLAGMTAGVQAREAAGEPYDAGETGSITVKLGDLRDGQGTPTSKKDVQVDLYRVGDLDTSNGYLEFSLVKGLKDVDVDLNDITSAEANTATAEKLAAAIRDSGIGAVSQWTDEDGVAAFDGLGQGMYLVLEGNSNAYGVFSASVVPVPYADETSWQYDVTIEPKGTPVTTLGRIDVTKMVKGTDSDGNLQDVHAKDGTYYVGLFMDADGERPYADTANNRKAVHVMDGHSGTVSFDNLPVTDQPYYIFETTEDGQPIRFLEEQGTDEEGFYCMAGEEMGAEGSGEALAVTLGEEAPVGSAVLTNVYYGELPDGYYYAGKVTISKSVMDNGQMVASEDAFYAGIFPVDAQGNVSQNPADVVKLNNNGTVKVEVPLGGEKGTEPVTYTVMETDEKGTPVDKAAFPYTVTGEGNVNLSLNQTSGIIHITNTLGGGEGYYNEEPSTQAPGNTGPGSGNNSGNGNSSNGSSGTDRSSRSTKTGDTNPVLFYLGIFAVAVVVGGAAVIRRRKHGSGR